MKMRNGDVIILMKGAICIQKGERMKKANFGIIINHMHWRKFVCGSADYRRGGGKRQHWVKSYAE